MAATHEFDEYEITSEGVLLSGGYGFGRKTVLLTNGREAQRAVHEIDHGRPVVREVG